MLREEVEKYISLTGDKEAWEYTSVSRIRGYLDGYDKGLEKLDKIRAEIFMYEGDCRLSIDEYPSCKQCTDNVFKTIYRTIDKYKAESEDNK